MIIPILVWIAIALAAVLIVIALLVMSGATQDKIGAQLARNVLIWVTWGLIIAGVAEFAWEMVGVAHGEPAPCADVYTMLERAEGIAEAHHGTAVMVQGPTALRLANAANYTGEVTHLRGDALVVITNPEFVDPETRKRGVVLLAFVQGGCDTGGKLSFSFGDFRAVLAKAYPKQKLEWRPL